MLRSVSWKCAKILYIQNSLYLKKVLQHDSIHFYETAQKLIYGKNNSVLKLTILKILNLYFFSFNFALFSLFSYFNFIIQFFSKTAISLILINRNQKSVESIKIFYKMVHAIGPLNVLRGCLKTQIFSFWCFFIKNWPFF